MLSYIPKDLENSLSKAYSTRRRLKFLKDCFAEQVLPKSLLPSRLRHLSNVPFDEFAALMLKKHIQETKASEKFHFKKLNHCRRNFIIQIPNDWKNILLDKIYFNLRRRLRSLDSKLKRKLAFLIDNSPWTKNASRDIVQNLSSQHIDSTTTTALGYGLSFAIDKKPSAVKIASAFKKLELQENVPQASIDIAKGMIYKEILTPTLIKGMPRRFIKSIRNIKSNSNIHITKADKSNSFVILDKNDYIEKMKLLLNDSSTYKKLNKNPLDSIIANFNKEVKIILRDYKDIINSISVRCPSLPYMYGLVKTHKDGFPLRPIISSVGSVSYKLSKYLVKILSPLLGNISGSHLINNEDLLNKLKEINISSNSKLVSFDVVSLFTKVPIVDLLNFLHLELNNFNLPIPNNIIINLIRLCVIDCKFVFNEEFYVQHFGMAMGNPLSPLLAGLYMEFFERIHLPPLNLKWLRYVDDCVAVVSNNTNLDSILENLNNKVSSIKFTIEIEKNNILPFLDVNIHKKDNNLQYSVYRKPTNNLSYIHFYSGHNSKIKESVFISMFLRALRICSITYLNNEIKIIYGIGKKLCYPNCFIDNCYSLAKKIFHKNNVNKPFNEEFCNKNALIIPYYSKFNNLPRLLKPLGISVIFKFENCLRNILINNSPKNDTNIIYKIPCCDCNGIYLGQTSKPLEIRIKQHKSYVKNYNNNSAIFRHIFEEDHIINWENSSKIININNFLERNIVESFLINSISNNFNISKGLCTFDPIMTKLLKIDLSSLLIT